MIKMTAVRRPGDPAQLTSAIFSERLQRQLILDNLTERFFNVDLELKSLPSTKLPNPDRDQGAGMLWARAARSFFLLRRRRVLCHCPGTAGEAAPEQADPAAAERRSPAAVLVRLAAHRHSGGHGRPGVQSFRRSGDLPAAAVLDSGFDAFLTVDLDTTSTLFNRSAEQLTGLQQDEVLGRPFIEVFTLPSSGLRRRILP